MNQQPKQEICFCNSAFIELSDDDSGRELSECELFMRAICHIAAHLQAQLASNLTITMNDHSGDPSPRHLTRG